MTKPTFRFAPSPNGELHLGHAYSALLNLRLARKVGGKMLLRIEDIDTVRCTPENEKQMLEDLEWIGFEWDEPPRRQSEHFDDYADALHKLQKKELLFASTLTRSQIKTLVAEREKSGQSWPRDPDGAPLYPGQEQFQTSLEFAEIQKSKTPYALRFRTENVEQRSSLTWQEATKGEIVADPLAWGHPILARKESPTSYHLSCVIDDALQGITNVVRGLDLYHATSLHRLLQETLDLPEPKYHHHALILDADGKKLSKSFSSTSLSQLRRSGMSGSDILHNLGKRLGSGEPF